MNFLEQKFNIGKKQISTDKINIYLFIILFELMFFILCYKVFYVPITHDETSTTAHYSHFSIWQIMMYPDNWPNNHILNTLMVKFLIWIFGPEQWVVRLPNLLSFLVYTFAVLRINKSILTTSSVFFLPASILFICNPYLLDFFCLSRGYGISVAFCALSVSFTITGFLNSKRRDIWLAYFLSLLAAYANFTLLVFCSAVVLLTGLYFIVHFYQQKGKMVKYLVLLIVITLAYAALISVPVMKMQSTDQFIYWKQSGFYNGTIVPLVIQSLYSKEGYPMVIYHAISVFTIVIVAGNIIYLLIRFLRPGSKLDVVKKPVFTASLVILTTALISIIQCIILQTPNLTGRTALFFYPLFIVALVATIGLIPNQKPGKINGFISLMISVLFIVQIAGKTSLNSVREWWFNSGTFEIIDYFEKTNPGQTVTLQTNWLFYPSFLFYKVTDKLPLIELMDPQNTTNTGTKAEYFYALPEDLLVLDSKFEIVYNLDNDTYLLRRKGNTNQSGGTTLNVRLNVNSAPGCVDEDQSVLFMEEYSPEFSRKFSDMTNTQRIFLYATIQVFPIGDVEQNSLNLVVTRENKRKVLNYFSSGSSQRRPLKPNEWNTLTTAATIVSGDKNDVIKAYLWNPRKYKIRIKDLKVLYVKK